jgi:hypothetical protein
LIERIVFIVAMRELEWGQILRTEMTSFIVEKRASCIPMPPLFALETSLPARAMKAVLEIPHSDIVSSVIWLLVSQSAGGYAV